MRNEPVDAVSGDRPQLLLESEAASVAATGLVCATCRQPLVQSGTEAMCVRCLVDGLVAAEGKDDVAATQRYGHFEVLTGGDGLPLELGRGAMGTTYRARDTVLHHLVALKVIEQNVAALPAARARFLREARAAARLRHPNVASVFHYGEQEGECFYAMELVEGETLEARVQRDGPLPVELALEIGMQVARALSAAEAQRLVHRDLKPSNLLLVAGRADGKPEEAPSVKVIDFGLAKAVAASVEAEGESETRHGFVGTPAFASPEQFAGGTRPVDTRSDLYSLGTTLWYLLCGRTPFRGNTLEEIHARQTGQPLPVAQLLARRVPAPAIALLRQTLAVDPAQRPQTAREFIEQLKQCQTRTLPAHHGYARRRWSAVAALVILGALVGGFVVSRRTEKAGAASVQIPMVDRSVAVLPFENLSPDPTQAFLAVTTQHAIAENLARVRELKVIGAESTRTYQPGARDLPRIGRELGVQCVLEGSVRHEDNQIQVSAWLASTWDGTRLWEKQYRAASVDAFPIYREITLAVVGRLQAALSSGEQVAVRQPPTSDPVAYDLYLRVLGEPFTDNDERSYRRFLQQHAALLEQALGRDPRFLLAWCELASVYTDLAFSRAYMPPEERTVDYSSSARAALLKARDLRPDAGEFHLAQANYLLKVEHDVARAHAECELARRTLPNNAQVECLAGRVARRQGRWPEAVRSLERAATLDPRDDVILKLLRETYRALRRYADFDRTTLRLAAIMPAGEISKETLNSTIGALEGRADLELVRRVRADRAVVNDLDGSTREYIDLTLAMLGRDADAVLRALAASGRERVTIMGVIYPNSFFEGMAARMRGDEAGARAAFARARPEVEKNALAEPSDGKTLSLLALIDAWQGRRDDAVREALRARELVMPYEKFAFESPPVRSHLAIVYAWTGQPNLAFAELTAIVDGPAASMFLLGQPTYGDFKLNPCWDPLRGDPRFDSLVKRLAPSK